LPPRSASGGTGPRIAAVADRVGYAMV